MSRENLSGDSLAKASKSTAEFSGHGDAAGAAGVREDMGADIQSCLDKTGESGLISPPANGFGTIHIGLSWNNIIVEQTGGFMGLFKKMTRAGVDLDLGCFFEMQDGTRGVLQAFGALFGQFDSVPYIALSGDERTGDAEGDDEFLSINGKEWPQIKRILAYAYIYEGVSDWSQIRPALSVNLGNGHEALRIQPTLKTDRLNVCALATLKNVKNGMQIITHGEYFNSQAAMDRAFGFGLEWEDGAKD